MIYGIDLGTTNSLIGTHGGFLSTLVPSIVDMKTGKAGEAERDNYDTMRNFKTGITVENSGLSAIVASSHVLEELKNVACQQGEIEAVISVPAYFNTDQRTATRAAANKAGIKCVDTINEPTAAAISISQGEDGLFIVFDLGGGTFDISVIEGKGGKYKVLATDGCILGGKDFDAALLVALGRDSGLKWRIDSNENLDIVSKAKIEMQQTMGMAPVPVHFTNPEATIELTLDTYTKCMEGVFEKAVLLTKSVITESGIDKNDAKFYFVGGSTRCPFLQDWVAGRLGITPAPITYNPDTIVAEGACYYAHLLETGKNVQMLEDVTKQIGMKMGLDIMEVIVPKNAHVPYKNDYIFIASDEYTLKDIHLEFYEGDSILASECNKIGELDFSFKTAMPGGTSLFGVSVSVDIRNTVSITVDEVLETPVNLTVQL